MNRLNVITGTFLGAVVTLMACSSGVDAGAQGDAAGPGEVTPCPVTPAAEAGPDFPNYVPPEDLPNRKACDATSACMVPTGTPCANPSEIPQVETWQCTCASGQWSCQLAYSSHSLCTNGDGGFIVD